MKSLSIYFGQYSLAFLNSWTSIMFESWISIILNKWYALFMNLFLQYFWGRGPTRWGPRGEGPRGEGRGSRNTNTHSKLCKSQVQTRGVTMLYSEFYRSKDKKYYKNWIKENVLVYILGFIFYGVSHAKTDLHNKYMI